MIIAMLRYLPASRLGLLLVLALAAHAQPMSGTYPVGPGGAGVDSFATVQAAATALSVRGLGGNVEFPITQAVYTGTVLVQNVANSRDYVTQFLPKAAGAWINAGGARYAFSVENTHNVTVQGLRFSGARDTGSACVRFANSDSGLVRGCRMTADSVAIGVLVENARNFRLDSARVEGNLLGVQSRGLDFRNCTFASVEKCSILGTVGAGVSMTGGSDNSLMMTGITTATEYGVRIENSPRVMVSRCAVHGATARGLHVVNSVASRFDSVLVSGTQDQAAYFEECDSLSSTALMIAGTSQRATRLVRSDNCSLMRMSIQSGPMLGLVLDHSTNCSMDSLQVVNGNSDTAVAVLLDSAPGSGFRYAMIYGNYGHGFSIDRSPRVRIVHARMHGGAAVAGIAVNHSSGLVVQPCSLVCVGGAGITLGDSCDNDTLQGMTILGNTVNGITVGNSRNLVLANSCVRNWRATGVALDRARSPQLCYNTIVGPESAGATGIRLTNVAGAEAKDNIVWNRGTDSSYCYGIDGPFPFDAGASDYSNLFASGAGGSTARDGGTVFATLADWRGHSSAPDSHSIARDPLFVPGDNYHLTASSPCLDSGAPIAGLVMDFEYDLRDPVAPDIGADEYTPGAVEDVSAGRRQLRLSVSPNPFERLATLRYTLAEPAQVRLSAIDVAGRRVLAPDAYRQGPGSFQEVLDLGALAPGVYVLRLSAGSLVASAKLVKQ
jgi:hypothetical protein